MNPVVTVVQLERDIDRFLRFKRAMGMPYRRGEFTLRTFLAFVAHRWGKRANIPLEEALRIWLGRIEGRKAVTVGLEFGVLRQLCLYRRRTDPGGFVPEHACAPVKASIFVPHIFTVEEIKRLLVAATSHHGRSLWGPMLRALMLVLYCTGLRLGEAVRMARADVDLERRILHVHHSKGRSRIVPFRDDLARELRLYLGAREQLIRARGTIDTQALFLRLDAKPVTLPSVSLGICRLMRKLGLKPPHGRVGPRPYEFRHAFAVHRLTEWARSGVDIHARLPWLSAYMGHENVLGTEVYLVATPELLELASRRFEAHVRRARRSR